MIFSSKHSTSHTIAIIGGSIAGSEAAFLLATHDFKIVVFEMNALPYGKIEDGLPNWHINLRNRQMKSIDSNLNHPNISFVPNVKIGTDINFEDLLNEWKFSAVILANGAWFDRRLPIEGVEETCKDCLVYQNPFIYWFNHKHEKDFKGNQVNLKEKIVVIGGGLASLDVVKAVMIEKLCAKLKEKYGKLVYPFDVEKKGVPAILKEFEENLENLNIQKVSLMYRRGERHMPLKSPKDETPEEIEKAQETSLKMLSKYKEKYLFDVLSYTIPVGIEINEDKLKGIFCKKSKLEDGKLIVLDDSEFLFECDQIISSIGSIPEQIQGLPYERGALKMIGKEQYQVFGYDNVFAVGNAVTGRGNIQESKQHGRNMTSKIISEHLSVDAMETWLNSQNTSIREKVQSQVEGIVLKVKNQPLPEIGIRSTIADKVQSIHDHCSYSSYDDWIARHIPERLEDQLEQY